MKRRLLAILLAVAFFISTCAMPAEAASMGKVQLRTLVKITYFDERNGTRTQKELKPGAGLLYSYADNLDTLYGWYTTPSSNEGQGSTRGIADMYAASTGNECAVTTKTPMWFAITRTTDPEYSFSEQFVVNRDTRIGAEVTTGNYGITFNKGISIENGTLMFKNEVKNGGNQPMNTNIKLNEPITVNPGGSLILENRVGANLKSEELDTLVAPSGKPAIIVNGGIVHSGCFEIKRAEEDSSNAPLIQVDRGELIFEAGNGLSTTETGMPTYETIYSSQRTTELDNGSSTSPAVVVQSGAKATVKGASFESTGTDPIIEVENGGMLELDNQTDTDNFGSLNGLSSITAKGDNTPAILVRTGGALTVKGADNNVTAESGQAIKFEPGAKVTVGDAEQPITVTVGGNDNTESYLNNDGIAVLAAGATMQGQSMNAAVVFSDGTVVEGNDKEAPTVTSGEEGGTIKVTVPEGGKVTKTDGTVTQMPAGGSVTSNNGSVGGSDVIVKPIHATDITLDRDTLNLYSNTTPNTATLVATVTPENTTDNVEWTSNAPDIASVTQNGVVTAHKDGTAIITAKAGDKTDTCTVNVSTYHYTGKYSYEISVAQPDNGSVAVDKYATEGETVTLTATPDDGYMLDTLSVTAGGKELEVTDNGDGTYSFTMPSSKVSITAAFAEDPDWVDPDTPEQPEEPGTTTVADIFNDVTPDAWYTDAVQYAYDNGLMTGTSATTFEPNTTTTRGMIVSMLHRLEGSPAVGIADFSDVAGGDWYADPVAWAASEGIVGGYGDGTFGPNDPITREQMASILYRYADYKGLDVSARASLDAYSDADSVSPWASDVMSWAVSEGIISGMTEDTLAPQGTATRAQVAAMFQRFLENVMA